MFPSSLTTLVRLFGLGCFMAGGFLPGLAADDRASVDGVINVVAYGAIGDGTYRDTAALQRAVDACAARGGGRVVLPAGRTFLSGAIRLRDHVDLHLARGACLKASDDCIVIKNTPNFAAYGGSEHILTPTQVEWGQTPAKFYGDALDKMHVRGFHRDHFSYEAN